MPQASTSVRRKKGDIYLVKYGRNDELRKARVLERKHDQVHVNYIDTDLNGLEEWIPTNRLVSRITNTVNATLENLPEFQQGSSTGTRQQQTRNDNVEELQLPEDDPVSLPTTRATFKRNFEYLWLGGWRIKTWYHSPFPPQYDLETILKPEPSKQFPKSRSQDLFTGRLPWNPSVLNPTQLPSLWVCHRCLTYSDYNDADARGAHVRKCSYTSPPGKKVYQRGSQTIWAVEAGVHKVYCTRLALLGKLFLDTKTLYFEFHGFTFYVLTEAISSNIDEVRGYFAKELNSVDGHNLATIVTFPPWQRQGYGMLMIEFSYELSRRAGALQTPERPLSDLGLRSYTAYWVATILRFLRHVLYLGPPPPLPSGRPGESDKPPPAWKAHAYGSLPDWNASFIPFHKNSDASLRQKSKKQKMINGDQNQVSADLSVLFDNLVITNPIFTSQRSIVCRELESGGVIAHVYAKCTIGDVARATNLRVEDCVFAMNEVGLCATAAMYRQDGINTNSSSSGMDIDPTIDDSGLVVDGQDAPGCGRMFVISRKMVDQMIKEKKVKRPTIDLECVLLDTPNFDPHEQQPSLNEPQMDGGEVLHDDNGEALELAWP